MKKVIAVATTAAMLVFAAVALAQSDSRVNQYDVTASTSPAVAGKAKRPVPVGVNFAYEVTEVNGLRPAPVSKYSIFFQGLRVNSNRFPGCTAAKINAQRPPSLKACPKKSIVGGGQLLAAAGPEGDQSSRIFTCYSDIAVVNSRRNRAAIFVANKNSTGPRPAEATFGVNGKCPINGQALQANFVRKGSGYSLNFVVPPQLRSNNNIEISVIGVSSQIERITKRMRGKRIGFFEAIGGCQNGKRAVNLTATSEAGNAQEAPSAFADC